jgi:cardiolipin synthase
MTRTKAFRISGAIALLVVAAWILLALFGPGLEYQVHAPADALDSELFLQQLEAISDSRINRNTAIEVLANGENYYRAELEGIRQAQKSVTLEAFIFEEGEIASQFVQALTERARAGVKVNLLADGVGSLRTNRNYFRDLRDAGGEAAFYHPIRWYTWPRYNNRTHREIIVVDGKTAFVGGAGVADHWLLGSEKEPRWRDTMFRVQGQSVARIQGAFVENWLEATGELLTGADYFPFAEAEGNVTTLVVNSTPSEGQSTRSRMLYQLLIASAKKSIYLTTPYFLPDRSARDELIKAMQRGVEVKVVVPGRRTDQHMTRYSSRTLLGELLKHGAKIYEYQPSMIHTKSLVVDGTWSVVGSTNIDSRSFGLNDEINVAARDRDLAGELTEHFFADVQQSDELTYDEWKKRGPIERVRGWLGLLLARQQ